jgi:two-component system chemotaxis response regulator CheY
MCYTKVIIAEKNKAFREALQEKLEAKCQVVGVTDNTTGLIKMAREKTFHVLFLDEELPTLGGYLIAPVLLTMKPYTVIIGLSWQSEEILVNRMLRAGAKGFLSKQQLDEDLLEKILQDPYQGKFFSSNLKYGRNMAQEKKNILLVNDFAISNEILSEQLENIGHRVIMAKNGKEALDMFLSYPFDLVITDYNMPGMDGIALTESIRAGQKKQNLPVIMISSVDDKEVKKEAFRAKITAWIEKPYKSEKTIQLINKILNP